MVEMAEKQKLLIKQEADELERMDMWKMVLRMSKVNQSNLKNITFSRRKVLHPS